MDSDTTGYAFSEAMEARRNVRDLRVKLDKAEARINYLGHIVNGLLIEIYGDDEVPEHLAKAIELANENW